MPGGLARMQSVRKLKELQQESSNVVNFSQRFKECCGVCGFISMVLIVILFVLVVIALGFAKLIIGGMYFHNCPAQPLIPTWLIVGAVVNLSYNCSCNRSKEGDSGYCKTILIAIVSLFTFVWLILGTVWILQAIEAIKNCNAVDQTESPGGRNQTDNTTSSTTSPAAMCDGCDKLLFNFAFAVLILEWCVTTLVLTLGLFCLCCYYCIKVLVD